MKISICIPTYKRNSYLRKALDSILKQKDSLSIKEIIIGDNNPSNILDLYLKKVLSKKKFHYFKNKENIGFEKNLYKIIKKASGDYILIITDDDYLDPSTIVNYKRILNKNNNITFICSARKVIKDNNYIRNENLFEHSCLINLNEIKKIAKLYKNSYVLTGLMFKNNKKYLNDYNNYINSKAPQMRIALNAIQDGESYYSNELFLNHTICNQVFWDADDAYMIKNKLDIASDLISKNNKLYFEIRKELIKDVPYLIYIRIFNLSRLKDFLNKISTFVKLNDFFSMLIGSIELIKNKIRNLVFLLKF